MRNIKSHDTKVEIMFRKALFAKGLRYRVRNNSIIGKPDIVFPSQRVAIFIDGDFWHGYKWESRKNRMQSNSRYWISKIERNIQRDLEVNSLLKSQGWTVLRFWEHDVLKQVNSCIEKVSGLLLTKNSPDSLKDSNNRKQATP